MANTYTRLLVHFVFSTKRRERSLTADIRPRLFQYIGGLARAKGMTALAVGGVDDHVHVLVGLPTTLSIAEAVKLIKGPSSRWLHETYPQTIFTNWQVGYGAFTISASQIPRTVAYIENQEAHHRTETFEDEYLRFLQANGVDFAPEYVWD